MIKLFQVSILTLGFTFICNGLCSGQYSVAERTGIVQTQERSDTTKYTTSGNAAIGNNSNDNLDKRIENMYNALEKYKQNVNSGIFNDCYFKKDSVSAIRHYNSITKKYSYDKLNCSKLFFKTIYYNLFLKEYLFETPNSSDENFLMFIENSPKYNPLKNIPNLDKIFNDLFSLEGENDLLLIERTNNLYSAILPIFELDHHFDWDQIFLKKSYEWRSVRENAYKAWYCNIYNSAKETYFDGTTPIKKELRQYIFDNFNKTQPSNEEIKVARILWNTLKDWGVSQSVIDDEDCQKRPWYVVGCFFEFFSVKYRIQDDLSEEQRNDLKEFFPDDPYEFYKRVWLKDPDYYNKVKDAILDWLIYRFGFTRQELQDKSLQDLLSTLKEQFDKVKPYHRFLLNSEFNNNKELKDFLERFIN